MRGWEKFMTERDREHDAARGKKEPFGFGDKPALILIDFYVGALGLTRQPLMEQIKTHPGGMGLEGWAAVDQTKKLLESARRNGIPVIHITKLDGDNVVGWAKRTGRSKQVGLSEAKMPEELKRRSAEIVAEVAPLEHELVIRKAAPSAFNGTVLPYMLQSWGIDTLIACGESTSGCVRATVVDGTTHSFKMGVVEECTFDRTEMSHWVNLFDLNAKYADVVKLIEAEAYFDRIGSRNSAAAQL
ncbi:MULTISPECIES: isochorismatase family protein [unclassified Paenibacillus]|uniref:isochorismatase family protein n=1 Tax=unclassified Paenibacillus TaxID=185978 RepID=UPI002406CB4D|nr:MULTISPECIES: isochorismatase family protein [unclassified Paenibacillus]MDF9842047.1 maleamate amidohydrolase [Paenibacillus sp. PastF-2]MDF9848699.1 maleamate amidohydrolase [Paenibacillus sp. PastM-2]MDF9855268.1 maleamate amidohydrolase [Paenibacillus sp. PastF-1]MDH6480539.1 maleamate amidohydrolase [Paenibacillus sp. PastH-2]MDH6507966.1 maleamate amidohydrolase [Paenibacillus sp. PastM-3]